MLTGSVHGRGVESHPEAGPCEISFYHEFLDTEQNIGGPTDLVTLIETKKSE